MELKVEHSEHATVVSVVGSIDALTAGEITNFMQEQLSTGHHNLVADFSQVDYTSSAGLRALLGTLKEARQLGGDLRLAAVQPNVNKVLELSGFTSILKMYPVVDAAVSSFAE